MAILAELGAKFPCTTQGYEIDLEDNESTMQGGDVVQAQWVTDKDVGIDAAFDVVVDVLKIKEEYPEFVLHYVKVETRRITVQYSIAPMGATHSPAIVAIITAVLIRVGILLAVILGLYLIYTAVERGYWLPIKPPTGTAVVTAWDTKELRGIAGVAIQLDGNDVGETASGGSIELTDIEVGPHIFTGEELPDYWPPDPVEQSVKKDERITLEIAYTPKSEPPPEYGWLYVSTKPERGQVFIDEDDYGLAPINVQLPRGKYMVSYGEIEGYITPDPEPATVVGNATTEIIGIYILPGDGWWEKYLKYALIGGGIIIGAAVIIPEVIRTLMRRGKTE